MCGCGPRQPLDSDLCDVDSGSRTVTEDSVDYPLGVPMIFTGLSTWPDLTVQSTHLVLSTSLDGSWRRPTLCSRPTLTLMDDLGLFLLIRLCCFHPAWSTRTTTTTTKKKIKTNIQKEGKKSWPATVHLIRLLSATIHGPGPDEWQLGWHVRNALH